MFDEAKFFKTFHIFRIYGYIIFFSNFFQTLEEWTDKSRFLIRFEHLFEAQEDPEDYSKPVSVDLKSMFKVFNIEKVEEVILGANLEVEKLKRLNWNVGNGIPDIVESRNIPKETDITDVILNPFQIRSFIVDITPKY